MNKISILKVISLFCFATLTPASADSKSKFEEVGGRLGLEKNQIVQISITTLPKRFEVMKATDSSHISLIVDYLNSIEPVKAKVNPQYARGSSYSIKIRFKNKALQSFVWT